MEKQKHDQAQWENGEGYCHPGRQIRVSAALARTKEQNRKKRPNRDQQRILRPTLRQSLQENTDHSKEDGIRPVIATCKTGA